MEKKMIFENIKELAGALVKADRFKEAYLLPVMANYIRPLPRYNGTSAPPILRRLLEKVAYGMSDCWYWRGSINRLGYGCMAALGESKAHRVAYRLFKGTPRGKMVLHTCDVRNCVNPDHLYLGTQRENMRDCVARGRHVCKPQRGEANPMARLTAEQVADMREIRRVRRLSARALAEMYGVSTMTAHRIIKGDSWK